MFLTTDKRWSSVRNYVNRVYGELVVTFIFGAIVSLVLPVMFWIQNCVQLSVESLFGVNDKPLQDILIQGPLQSMIQYDRDVNTNKIIPKPKKRNTKYFVGLTISHAAYISFPILLLCLMQFMSGNGIICRPLTSKTTFLLNNHVTLPNNLTYDQIYNQRKIYGSSRNKWFDWKDNGGLLWDDYESEKKHDYMPLRNITDFVNQFNFVGYNDVCNYFEPSQIEVVLSEVHRSKGFRRIFPGFARDNATGLDQLFD